MSKMHYQIPHKQKLALITAAHHESQKLRHLPENSERRYLTAMITHGLGILRRDAERAENKDDTEMLMQKIERQMSGDTQPTHCASLIAELGAYVETKLAVYNPEYQLHKPDALQIKKSEK